MSSNAPLKQEIKRSNAPPLYENYETVNTKSTKYTEMFFGKIASLETSKMRYSPYVNKGFVYISVSKILNFIRQLFIFS